MVGAGQPAGNNTTQSDIIFYYGTRGRVGFYIHIFLYH